MRITIPLVLLSGAVGAQALAVIVPGTSDPWLAGMPNGTTASLGDVAPGQSPVLALDGDLGGCAFTFSAAGAVVHGPTLPLAPPDGSGLTTHYTGGEHGISDTNCPINCLIGVFLDSQQPDQSPAPASLDFSSPASRDYASLAPDLKQVFFIGNGLTSGGDAQSVVAPAGATRLFLGTMDGFGWYNNIGSFTVDVSQDCITADTQGTPRAFELAPVFPNPFNPTTTIRFSLAETAVAGLKVYNLSGRQVASLVDGLTSAGEHSVVFDATGLGSGVYFYTLDVAGTLQTRKMILAK